MLVCGEFIPCLFVGIKISKYFGKIFTFLFPVLVFVVRTRERDNQCAVFHEIGHVLLIITHGHGLHADGRGFKGIIAVNMVLAVAILKYVLIVIDRMVSYTSQ